MIKPWYGLIATNYRRGQLIEQELVGDSEPWFYARNPLEWKYRLDGGEISCWHERPPDPNRRFTKLWSEGVHPYIADGEWTKL